MLECLIRKQLGRNAILIRGTKKNRSLTVLVDSGAPSQFCRCTNSKGTGHHPVFSHPIRVTVADGNISTVVLVV